jgi:hypothetical protein
VPLEATAAAPTFPAHPGADERETGGGAAERVTSSAATTATASTAATAIARRSRLCRARRFASAISRCRENGNLGTSASIGTIIGSTKVVCQAVQLRGHSGTLAQARGSDPREGEIVEDRECVAVEIPDHDASRRSTVRLLCEGQSTVTQPLLMGLEVVEGERH